MFGKTLSSAAGIAALAMAIGASEPYHRQAPPYRARQRLRPMDLEWRGTRRTKGYVGAAGAKYKGSPAAKRASRRGGNPARQA